MISGSEPTIRDYLNIIRRRKAVFAQVFVVMLAVGVLVTLLAKPVFQTEAKLVIPPAPTTITMQDAANPMNVLLASTAQDNLPTQIQVLQSREFLDDVAKASKLPPRPGIMEPQAHVEAIDPAANVILITTQGGNPQDIVTFTTTMVREHLKRARGDIGEKLDSLTAFVSDQKARSQRQLVISEEKLLQFNKVHHVIQLKTEQDARAREFVDLEATARETQSNLASLDAQVRDLQGRVSKEPSEYAQKNSRENTLLAKLQEQLASR